MALFWVRFWVRTPEVGDGRSDGGKVFRADPVEIVGGGHGKVLREEIASPEACLILGGNGNKALPASATLAARRVSEHTHEFDTLELTLRDSLGQRVTAGGQSSHFQTDESGPPQRMGPFGAEACLGEECSQAQSVVHT